MDLTITDQEFSKKITGWIMIAMCKLPASVMYTYCFNYMAEVYPTQIRGAGAGIVTAVARYLGASSALIEMAVRRTAVE